MHPHHPSTSRRRRRCARHTPSRKGAKEAQGSFLCAFLAPVRLGVCLVFSEKNCPPCRSRGRSFDVSVEPALSPAPNPQYHKELAMRFMVIVKATKESEAG